MRPDDWHWDTDTELLATLIQVVDQLNRNFIRANSKQGTPQPKPISIERPWERTRKGTTLSELVSMMRSTKK